MIDAVLAAKLATLDQEYAERRAALEQSHVVVKFPTWLYHVKHPPMLVETQEQRDALGSEWSEIPIAKTAEVVKQQIAELRADYEAKIAALRAEEVA